MRVPVVAVGNRVLCGFPRSGGRVLCVHGSRSFHGRRAIFASNDVVPFCASLATGSAEVNGPEAVGDLLEANRVLLERIRDEEQALLEAECARILDALDDEVSRIFDRWQLAGVLAP